MRQTRGGCKRKVLSMVRAWKVSRARKVTSNKLPLGDVQKMFLSKTSPEIDTPENEAGGGFHRLQT